MTVGQELRNNWLFALVSAHGELRDVKTIYSFPMCLLCEVEPFFSFFLNNGAKAQYKEKKKKKLRRTNTDKETPKISPKTSALKSDGGCLKQ